MAAKDAIKGIVVEIGGNTTRLNDALKDVEKPSKDIQSELKSINALLKFDPENTVALTQKQELLGKSVEAAAEKLRVLNEAQAQVEEQFQKGEIGEDAYRAFTREIEFAEQALIKAEKAVSNFNDEQQKTVSVTDTLKSTISGQESELKKLKDEYTEIVLTQGKGSTAASELEEKFRALDSELSENRKNLNEAEEATGDFAKEQKAVTASLDALKDTIASQENQLKTLSDRYTDVVLAQGKNSKAARELRNEISALEQELSDNKATLNDASVNADELTESIKDSGEAAEEAEGKFEKFGGVMGKVAAGIGTAVVGISGAVAGAVGYAVSFADDAKGALNGFQAAVGASAEEMDAYKGVMDSIYAKNYGESFEDIANSMATVQQSYLGDLEEQQLEDVTTKALMMRDTFEFDVAESIRAVNQLMSQFGISSDEAFNLIAQGAQNGLNKNGDLLDVVSEYSVHYAQMGMGADEMFNSLVNGANSGAFSVDKLGDAMKEFGIRAKDNSEATQQAFADLGLAAMDNSADIEKTQKNVDSYSSKIADLEDKLELARAKQSEFNDKTSEASKLKIAQDIEKYNEQLSQARTNLSNAQTELSNLNSAAESGMSAGDFGARFAAGGESAKQALSEVANAIFALDDPMKQNEIGVALFGTMWEDSGAEAIRAMTDMEGKISSTTDAMSEINAVRYDTFGEALTGLNRMVQMEFVAPLGEEALPLFNTFISDLSAGVESADGDMTLLVDAIFDALDGLVGQIQELLPEILETVTGIVESLIEGIAENLPQLAEVAVEIAMTLISALVELLPEILDAGIQILLKLIEGITSAIPDLIPTIVSAMIAIVQVIIDNLPMLVDAALDIIMALAEGLLAAIPQLIEALPDIIDGIITFLNKSIPQLIEAGILLFTALVEALPEIIRQLVAVLPQIIEGLIGSLLGNLYLIIDAGITLFTALVEALPEIIAEIVKAIPTILKSIIKAVQDNLGQVIAAGVTLFVSLISNLPKIILEIVKAVPQIVLAIVDAFSGQFLKIVEVGENLIKGLWEGISKMANWIGDKITGFCEGIVNGFKWLFGIQSPSTLFRDEIGMNLAAGIGEGFMKEMENVSAMMHKAVPTDFSAEVNAAYNASNVSVSGNSGVPDGLASGSETNIFNISINASDVKEFNDIIRIAQNARVSRRLEYVKG